MSARRVALRADVVSARGANNASPAVPPPAGWPPHLTLDDVVWHKTEYRWVGRTSPRLSKRDRRAEDEARVNARKVSRP
jgi:hypothetical protein